MSIGNKIRDLRKSKNMSIAEFSALSGLSTGLISLIERDKTIPTITVMLKIVNTLDVTMGYFFDDEENDTIVIHKDKRNKIITSDESRIYELLTPTHNQNIEFVLIRLNNCKDKLDNAVSHVGEECGYVIKGNMVVIINNERYVLNEGDSIYFNSTKPHIYENYDDDECISIWAMTPPSW